MALVGCCRAAQELGHKAELLAALVQRRPSVLTWMHTPVTMPVHHLTRELPPLVSSS